jgi:hypothetical protein
MNLPPKLRWRSTSLLALLLLFTSSGFAQKVLVVEGPNPKQRLRIWEGMPIDFIDQNGLRILGTLQNLEDSTFSVNGDDYKLSNVQVVMLPRRGMHFLYNLAFVGAGFYMSLDVINAIFGNERPIFNPGTLVVTGSLVAGGFLFRAFRFKRMRVGNKWTLKILDTTP